MVWCVAAHSKYSRRLHVEPHLRARILKERRVQTEKKGREGREKGATVVSRLQALLTIVRLCPTRRGKFVKGSLDLHDAATLHVYWSATSPSLTLHDPSNPPKPPRLRPDWPRWPKPKPIGRVTARDARLATGKTGEKGQRKSEFLRGRTEGVKMQQI